MKRIGALLAVLVASLAFAGGAAAVVIPGTLDQHQNSGPDSAYWNQNYSVAQTFTAGLTGSLDAVTFNLGTAQPEVVPAAVGDLSVQILATSGGVPSGSPLATENITGAVSGGLYLVTFTSPASVASGTQYALVLTPGTSSLLDWLGVCGSDAYAGGSALVFDSANHPSWMTVPAWASAEESNACTQDFEFATYVTEAATPSPTATAPATATALSTVTAPPTATAPVPADTSRGEPMLLILASGLALAGALLALKRVRAVRG